MKNIITSALFLFFNLNYSQIAVGKTLVTNPSVSLEFAQDNRGFILPWVTSDTSVVGAVDGTIIYDTADKKVKYQKSGAWFDMSIDTTGIVDTGLQDSKVENLAAKTLIGSNPSLDTTPGILVLKDSNKAMVLPKVASPHLNIINPAAGMIVYDTTAHQLAVFNGTAWSFWKP